jgi:MerC mercury resistance protein
MKDFLAMLFSLICIIHCLMTPVLLMWGIVTVLSAEWVHSVMMLPCMCLAILSLPVAYKQHRVWQPILLALSGLSMMAGGLLFAETYEAVLTICGALLLMVAHLRNRTLSIRQRPLRDRAQA